VISRNVRFQASPLDSGTTKLERFADRQKISFVGDASTESDGLLSADLSR
jgi:hypothetical protein